MATEQQFEAYRDLLDACDVERRYVNLIGVALARGDSLGDMVHELERSHAVTEAAYARYVAALKAASGIVEAEP